MAPDRWLCIEEIFGKAVELSPNERNSYLATACQGDETLRRELEILLEADSQNTAIQNLRNTVDAEVLEQVAAPRRIGPWRIVGVIGGGGMGTVYQAERDDGLFHKQVAIKVLRLGLESEFALARFRYERRILGGLEHRHIARLIDGGEVDGRPYIVMEFVEGVPVTEYCRQQALDVDARIALFRDICGAVQYAHQRLVIHRDLKPSNILVTADGTVKLLDFGIAKLEDPDVVPDEAAQTSTGMRMMTPEYASPEQVRGETVTAASDVYALGAVLFELLTSSKAHRLTRQDPAELVRVVCEEQIVPLSTVAPVEWRRKLAGDLDNIVGKALQKDPQRRYQSVQQFSEDLTAYLDGHPVAARPDTAFYRVGKFLRRNSWTSAMAALLVVSLMAGAGVSIYQARRAERRFEQVRGLARTFLFDVNDEIENLPGATKARQMLVSTASTYLNSLASEAGGDRSLLLEVAAAYQKIGDVLGDPYRANLGRPQDALKNYRRSLQIAEPLAQGTRDPAIWRLVAWGKIKAATFSLAGLPEIKSSLEIANRIGRWQGKPETELLMDAHRSLGDVVFRTVGWAAALQEFESCLSAAQAVGKLEGRSEEIRTRCLQRAGKAQGATGDLDAAMSRFREARAGLLERIHREPRHLEHRRNLLIVLIECARWTGNPSNQNLGDVPSSVGYLTEALQVARALRAEDPNDALAPRNEAAVFLARAEVGQEADLVREQEWLREAIRVTEQLSVPAVRTHNLSVLAAIQARVWERLGRYAEARSAMQSNVEDISKRIPHDFEWKLDMVGARMSLAHLELSMGNNSAAAALYKAEVAELQSVLKERPDEFYTVFALANVYATLAQCENSTEWARRGADLWGDWTAHGGKGDWAVRQRNAALALAERYKSSPKQ